MCDNLYDHLRPRILHEPSLETLCGVCTVLQALMVQDVNPDDDPDEVIISPATTPGYSPNGNAAEDYFSQAEETFSARQRRTGSVRGYSGSILTRRDTPKSKRRPLDRLHTEVLLRMVLQDAQTRLVFRAQALLRADVEYYVPKDGDLDYPDKIKGESRCADEVRQRPLISRAIRQAGAAADVSVAGRGGRLRAGLLGATVCASARGMVPFAARDALDPVVLVHLRRCESCAVCGIELTRRRPCLTTSRRRRSPPVDEVLALRRTSSRRRRTERSIRSCSWSGIFSS